MTIVTVTHNSSALLTAHFGTVEAALEGVSRHEIIVVDSGSTDQTVEVALDHLPSDKVVVLDGNLGYAAGVNAGIRAGALAGPVLVLNPDTRPSGGSIRRLLEALQLPGAGISVPRLVDDAGVTQRSLRRRPTILRAFGEAVLGGRRAGRFPPLGEVVQDELRYQQAAVVDWATGAAMCIGRGCLDAVGQWDESYFLYSEETDFALRASDAGYLTRYVPDAVMVHDGGDSHISPGLFSLLTVNRVRLYRGLAGPVAARLFWLAVVLQTALRALGGSPVQRAALRALFRPRTVVVADQRRGTDRSLRSHSI